MPWTMRAMARSLRAQGFRTIMPWYESWATPFDAIVERLSTKLKSRNVGQDRPVHIVGHSMGGLIGRVLADRLHPAMMGRMVMIGTPNAGSELADLCTRLPIPLLGRAAPTLVTRRLLPSLDRIGTIDYRLGVIAGDRPLPSLLRVLPPPHDGRVSVASTHVEGQADHIVLPVSHAIMPSHPAVQRQTSHFLIEGRFTRDD